MTSDPQHGRTAAAAEARRRLYAPGGGSADDLRIAAEQPEAAEPDPPPAAAAPPTAVPRSRPSLRTPVAVAVVALLVGAAVGAGVERFRASATPPALSVFATPASASAPVPGAHPLTRGATVRYLRSFSSVGLDVYAVRTAAGRVCLLADEPEVRAQAACATASAFAAGGIELVVEATADPIDLEGTTPTRELAITWAPNGRVAVQAIGAS